MDRSAPVAIRTARRLSSVIWLVALGVVIGLAAWSHLDGLVIVAGSSMEPALPAGSLIRPAGVSPSAIVAGDVVTARADNGVLVTHRVVRLADLPGGRYLELRGDANPQPDPVLVPADAVVGRVDLVVPLAGYLLAMLATPMGLMSIVGLLGAWLLTIWMLEDLESARGSSSVTPQSARPARSGSAGAAR
jgi:signal peptidase I